MEVALGQNYEQLMMRKNMKYENYELLDLFETEPEIINQEAQMFRYITNEISGFKFSLSIWGYEDYASITLTYKNLVNPLYAMSIDNVSKIQAKKDTLFIYKYDTEEPIIIYFKPNFSLRYRLTQEES